MLIRSSCLAILALFSFVSFAVAQENTVATKVEATLDKVQGGLESVADKVNQQMGKAAVKVEEAATKADATKDSVREYVGDAEITAAVKARLLKEKGLESRSIHVKTTNGVVTLTGNMESASQRKLVEQVTATVKGVERVENQLIVRRYELYKEQ